MPLRVGLRRSTGGTGRSLLARARRGVLPAARSLYLCGILAGWSDNIRPSSHSLRSVSSESTSLPAFGRVNFPGPFSHHEVVVDGWTVPLIHAHPTGENDESVMLVIDGRLAITVSVEEAERFVPFLADAVAVALGYTSHPNKDAEQPLVKQPQPRPVRMHGIADITPPKRPNTSEGRAGCSSLCCPGAS